MRTAEEVLDDTDNCWDYKKRVKIINSYAKEKAIAFAEWIENEGWIKDKKDGKWYFWRDLQDNVKGSVFTTVELFTIFEKETGK